MFFSPYFLIKKINVVRQDDLVNPSIVYKSIEGFRYTSIFFVPLYKIEESIKKHQPHISFLKIKRIFPDTLQIVAESFPWAFTFKRNNQWYILTKNGVAVPTFGTGASVPLLEIRWIDTVSMIEYRAVMDAEIVSRIEGIIQKIYESIMFIKIKRVLYYKKERELHLYTSKGMILIFDIQGDIGDQIEKLLIFNKKYFKEIEKGIVYIDLRIKDRIFYCPLSNEYVCKKNLEVIYK